MNDTPIDIPFKSIFDMAPEKFAEISVLPRELPTKAGSTVTLQDPSTLHLALVGAGLIGAYWLATRFLRPTRSAIVSTKRASARPAVAAPVEKRKRGAA